MRFYGFLIVKPLQAVSKFVLWKGIDQNVIDKGRRQWLRTSGPWLGARSSGNCNRAAIRNYATWVLAGSLLIIFVMGLVGGGR